MIGYYPAHGAVTPSRPRLLTSAAALFSRPRHLGAMVLPDGVASTGGRLCREKRSAVVPVPHEGEPGLDRSVDVSEDERRRLASYIYDGPLQQLTAIGFSLARAHMLAARGDTEKGQGVLAEANAAVERAASGLREALADLATPVLEGSRGLHGAIRDHLMRLDCSSPMECVIESQLESRASRATEVVLYRIAQEALANVVAHSSARHAAVDLFRDAGSVVLTVRDDGVGFNSAVSQTADASRGFGLRYMRDRAVFSGGELTVTTFPKRGTLIRASIPEK